MRGGKDEVANFADWNRQADAYGWARPASFLEHGPPVPEREAEVRQREAYEVAVERLSERLEQKAVITHHEVRTAAFQGLIHAGNAGGIADADAVTRLMREEGVLQYGEKTALVWGREAEKRHVSVTTALHQEHEAEFIRLAGGAAADRSGAIPAELLDRKARESGLDFSDAHGKAQKAAMDKIAEGSNLSMVVGVAGSGKSALLRPLIAAWKEQGRDVHGASLAWRQADELTPAGIDPQNVKALSVMLDGLEDGSIKLTEKSVVAVDEWALLGTRQGLELLRHRDKAGFQIVALGDDKQLVSIEAGAIVDLCRLALGPEEIPEILTTKRQQTEREQKSVALLREGRAAEYLAMKREDGTVELVPGRAEDVISRVAKLYAERLEATGRAPTIAAPTNQDAHLIGGAVRKERRKMGLLGNDISTVKATDGTRQYTLALAQGDRVRLYRSTGADYGNGQGGPIGRNGDVLEVVGVSMDGLKLKSAAGKVGTVGWEKLADKKTGRTLLGYGDCLTVHSAQGSTADECPGR